MEWTGREGRELARAVRGNDIALDGRKGSRRRRRHRGVNGTLITVCPWWDGPYAASRSSECWRRCRRARRPPVDLVYHAPPEGVLSWTASVTNGDALRRSHQRFSPTAVLCGHIHEAPSRPAARGSTASGKRVAFQRRRQIGDIRRASRSTSRSRRRAGSPSPASRSERFSSPARPCLRPGLEVLGCMRAKFTSTCVHQRRWPSLSAYCRLISTR